MTNDAAVSGVHSDQGSSGFQCFAKEHPEDILLVPIFDGMLFPDERIGGHVVEHLEVLGSKRSEFYKRPLQNWLAVKRHVPSPY